MKLTANFTLEEFLANPYGIVLTPTNDEILRMKELCETCLEPIRLFYKTPVKITSGFRDKQVIEKLRERGYPASPTSQHLRGEAADFVFPYRQDQLLLCFGWIKTNISSYGQNIYYYRPGHPMQEAIHISLGKKRENLIHFKNQYHKAETFRLWV